MRGGHKPNSNQTKSPGEGKKRLRRSAGGRDTTGQLPTPEGTFNSPEARSSF